MHVVEFIGLQSHAARHVVVVWGEGVPQFRRPGLPLPAGLVPASRDNAQLLQDAQRLLDLLFPGLTLLGISPEGCVVVQRVVVDLLARAMDLTTCSAVSRPGRPNTPVTTPKLPFRPYFSRIGNACV